MMKILSYLVILAASICSLGIQPASAEQEFSLWLQTDKRVYSTDESIYVDLLGENKTDSEIIITSISSTYPPGPKLGNVSLRDKHGEIIIPGLISPRIGPGKVWDHGKINLLFSLNKQHVNFIDIPAGRNPPIQTNPAMSRIEINIPPRSRVVIGTMKLSDIIFPNKYNSWHVSEPVVGELIIEVSFNFIDSPEGRIVDYFITAPLTINESVINRDNFKRDIPIRAGLN